MKKLKKLLYPRAPVDCALLPSRDWENCLGDSSKTQQKLKLARKCCWYWEKKFIHFVSDFVLCVFFCEYKLSWDGWINFLRLYFIQLFFLLASNIRNTNRKAVLLCQNRVAKKNEEFLLIIYLDILRFCSDLFCRLHHVASNVFTRFGTHTRDVSSWAWIRSMNYDFKVSHIHHHHARKLKFKSHTNEHEIFRQTRQVLKMQASTRNVETGRVSFSWTTQIAKWKINKVWEFYFRVGSRIFHRKSYMTCICMQKKRFDID